MIDVTPAPHRPRRGCRLLWHVGTTARRCSTTLDHAAALDARLRAITQRTRRHPGARQRAVEGRRRAASRRQRRRRRGTAGREPCARRRPRRRSPPSTTRSTRRSGTSCSSSPTCRIADAPDGASDADNPVVTGPFGLRDTFPEHQRVPHWETATALGILDNERATKIAGSMFTMQRGAGATLARALCQYGARPQRRRVRGDPRRRRS